MYEPLADISDRAVPAEPQPDPAEQPDAARDQPARSSSPTWSGSTTRWPASCSGASTRPTSAAAVPAVLGRASGSVPHPATPDAARGAARHPADPHLWARDPALGDHNNRATRPAASRTLVLVIRGELLKRYPNAVIYAQRAAWRDDADGSIDPAKERDARAARRTHSRPTAARHRQDPAVRGASRPRHRLPRLRPDRRRGAGRHRRRSPATIPAGSS